MENVISLKIVSILFCAAFLVGIINATFGVGGSLLAYPLLSYWLDGKSIIGVLSIVVIVATASRLVLYRQYFSPRAVNYFLVLGIPFSVAGAFALSLISVAMLQVTVGIFLIIMTLYEWTTGENSSGPEDSERPVDSPKYFIAVGAVSGFLTGMIGSSGFINTSFLLRAGFVKESISVNQAGIALAYSLIKLPVYWEYGIVTPAIVAAGIAGSTGAVMGTFLGSRLLRRLSTGRFVLLLRLIIIIAGGNLIRAGLQHL
jgi:uncharacterized protein